MRTAKRKLVQPISIYEIIDDAKKLTERDSNTFNGLLPVVGYIKGVTDGILRCNAGVDWGSPKYFTYFYLFVAQFYDLDSCCTSPYLTINRNFGDPKEALRQYFSLVDDFRNTPLQTCARTKRLVDKGSKGERTKVIRVELRTFFPTRSFFLCEVLGDGTESERFQLHRSIEAGIEYAEKIFSIDPSSWSIGDTGEI